VIAPSSEGDSETDLTSVGILYSCNLLQSSERKDSQDD